MPPARRLIALMLSLGSAAAGAQTRIENVATLEYRAAGVAGSVQSNRVVTDVAAAKLPTRLEFRLLTADTAAAAPGCVGQVVELSAVDPATLSAAPVVDALDMTQATAVVLHALGGNRDPAVREEAIVLAHAGGIAQQVRLIETAPNSGVFAGAVPPSGLAAGGQPCGLELRRGEWLQLSFPEDEFSLTSRTEILVDPAGVVFDSATGQPIDGATVSLVDAAGRPATVLSDDRRSAYPASVVSGASVSDASGRRYPGMPGRYRFPLIPAGTYYLRITPPPDYRAPSAVPRAALAALRDRAGRPFVLNDASFGGALLLASADPFLADLPIDRDAGTALLVSKTASVRDASPGDVVQYRIRVTNRGTAAARGLHLADRLPPGLRYQRGSTRGGDEPAVSADGRDLDLSVTALAVGATAEVTYRVSVTPDAPPGEAVNRVSVAGPSNGSNVAMAAVRIRPLLFTDATTVIGRVEESACDGDRRTRRGVAGIRLLLEDGTYVVTDRDGLYHFEGVRPGRHVVQLDRATIPVGYEAVPCDADTRNAGSATSRFVEGGGGMLLRADFRLRATGAAVTDKAKPPSGASDGEAAGNRDWLAGQATGVGWLFPAAGHNPRAPVLRAVVKHLPGQQVALTLNGRAVDTLAFDGSATAGSVSVSTWTGLPLELGDNRLAARVLDGAGAVVTVLERTVHYAGAAARVTLDPERSRLVADGLTRPLLAVRVSDAAGYPVRAGTLVPFAIDAPYAAAIDADLQQARQLAGMERAASTARVTGDDGYAFIALQPTTRAGAVRAVVSLAGDRRMRAVELGAWLAAGRQDWLVVGFGVGTIGYDVLSRHRAALPPGGPRGLTGDGQLALYAKGRVKGSWLLTLAYDSDRRFDRDRALLGTIDPDRYYTVYGDMTAQGYDAPTRRKLYLRLERREFYALFGDFETGLTETRLGRYSRTLNGVQAAYAGRRLRASGFVAGTDQRYARDEIRGSGLSGPYRLASRDIVPGSDQVRIEVRDRFRSDRILSSRGLVRHIDYDIDTELGTLRFREPILSRDAALNPIFVVADYEVDGIGAKRLAAAGRAAVRVGAIELGATAIRDETNGATGVLAGDLRAKLSPATELRAEYARGGRGGLGAGTAWLAEAEHHGRRIDATLYARQQDRAFGVGQQNLVEAGTRKIGGDGRIVLTDRLSLAASGWYQDNLAAAGTRTAGDLRLEYARAAGAVFAGFQFARDRGLDRDRDSRLITLRGSQVLAGGALTLDAQTAFAPGGPADSVDFPVRHQLTARWRVNDGVRLIGGYEIAQGSDYLAHTARIGFDVAPWAGAKLTSTLNQQAIGEDGARAYAQYGLAQSLTLGRRWSLDVTLDSTRTVRGTIPPGSMLQASASDGVVGLDAGFGAPTADFTAVTLGATYRAALWSWNGRIEYRDADTDRRWGVTSNLLRTLGAGRTLAASLRGYRVTDRDGATAIYGAADVAVAWRPTGGAWSLLERLSVRHEDARGSGAPTNLLGIAAYGSGEQDSTRVINNLAVNLWAAARRGQGLEATFYHGAKYVRGRITGDRFDGFIQVLGVDVRRNIGRRFDAGVQGSIQHAWTAHAMSWSGGPSAGASPAGNLWVSAGYNLSGYRDRDFEDDRYTRQGPYLTLRAKFDQSTLAGLIR